MAAARSEGKYLPLSPTLARAVEVWDHRWTQAVSEEKVRPPTRAAHAAGMVGSNTMVVFGGRNMETQTLYDDTWLLDVPSQTWSLLDAPRKPPKRMYVATAIWGQSMIIFSGRADLDQWTCHSDGWILSLQNREWRELAMTGDVPAPRCAGAALLLEDTFLVMGGSCEEELNDGTVYSMDLHTSSWRVCKASGTSPFSGSGDIHGFSVQPVQRYKPTAFILWGGQRSKGRGMSPTAIYHAEVAAQDGGLWNITWCALKSEGGVPSPRFNHCMCRVTDNAFVVFGGVGDFVEGHDVRTDDFTYDDAYLLLLTGDGQNSQTAHWRHIEAESTRTTGFRPDKRQAFSMVGIPGREGVGLQFCLFGGGAFPTQYYNDTWIYNVQQAISIEVGDAKVQRWTAFVKRVVGLVRLISEDAVQGTLQLMFLYEFWNDITFNSRLYTISSVVAGVLCSALGPIKEFFDERRQRDEQKRMQATIDDLARQTADAEEVPATPRAHGVAPLLAEEAGFDGQRRPSAGAIRGDDDDTNCADVIEYFRSSTRQYIVLLLLTCSFWCGMAAMPWFLGHKVVCGGRAPWEPKLFFVAHTVMTLCFEVYVAGQTRKGKMMMRKHWKGLVLHGVLCFVGRYDVFSDVMFAMLSQSCGFSLTWYVIAGAVVSIGLLQAVPGMVALVMRSQWALGFRFNDMNILLASAAEFPSSRGIAHDAAQKTMSP